MASINQQGRADAYHRNMIALIFMARAEYFDCVKRDGETIEAAMIRIRLHGLVTAVEQIEAGNYHTNCEACGRPLLDGQQVIYFDDAGDVHVDCEDPNVGDLNSHAYDSGYRPGECVRELELAKVLLARADEESSS